MNFHQRATQLAVAYVLALSGGLAAASIALRQAARTVERTAGVQ